MGRKVPLFFLFFIFIFTSFGCESFMVTNPETRRDVETETSDSETVNTVKINETFEKENETKGPPKKSGYLVKGSTVKLNTGEGKSTSVLEQFVQTKKELVHERKTVVDLKKALESEKNIKKELEAEIELYKEQLVGTQQVIIEVERLGNEIEGIRVPYEKTIEELTLLLAKSQIEETKTKKELISLRIESLMKKKKKHSDKYK